MSFDQRIAELNLQLPEPPKVLGVYRPVNCIGRLAHLSGHGPLRADGTFVQGRLGAELNVDAGRDAARLAGIAVLASLKECLGSFDKVSKLVRATGYINATPEFFDLPAVMNGFSELMRDVFGEDNGIAARSAVGVASLPGGWPVEIETVFLLNVDYL
jgi:enamine deaminase RidA (YjgF/YER057c/UK114 family)